MSNTAGGETLDNNHFYATLVQALSPDNPQTIYADAHERRGALPPSADFAGGNFRLNDNLIFMMNTELRGEPGVDHRADRVRNLGLGRACLDLEINVQGGEDLSLLIGRMADLDPDYPIVKLAVEAGARDLPPEEAFVFRLRARALVEAGREPPLLALYNHLATPL